ncbi:MAG: DUF6876 family protein [Elusimicrobiota bacterium]
MDTNEKQKLEDELKTFTGTEHYFRNFTGLIFTDGIQYLAEKTGAHWLIDLIGSYQYKLKNIPFQLWTIKVNDDKTAEVICKEDTHTPIIVKQKLEYTDFPLKNFECYCIDGILLLTTEN